MFSYQSDMKVEHSNSSLKPKSYDRLAEIYQVLETLIFADRLHKARTAHIDQLKNAKKVLILGEGDGRFLKALLQLNPNCQVDCLDSSKAMLLRTEKRLKKANLAIPNIRFIHADALSFQYAAQSYDVVISLFFLDNFTYEQLESLIPKLVLSLKEDGRWLVADFQYPQNSFMKYLGSSLIWIMYRFFRWQTDISATTLANPKSLLEKKLTVTSSKQLLASLLYSEVWSLKT